MSVSLALLWFEAAVPAFAHDPGLSTASVRLRPGGLEAVVTLSLKDAGTLVNLDADHDGRLAADEISAGERLLGAIGHGALAVTLNDRVATAQNVRCEIDGNSNATVRLEVPASHFTTLHIRSPWLAQLPPGHRQFLSIQDEGGIVITRKLLSADENSVTIELHHAETKATQPAKHWVFVCVVLFVLSCGYLLRRCLPLSKAAAGC